MSEEKTNEKWVEVITPSAEVVKIRRMKLRDEDILTDMTLARNGGTTDALLTACTDRGAEEIERMLIGDRTFLLIEIRKLRSPEYRPTAKCPACEATGEQCVDLGSLRLQPLDETKLGPGRTFKLTLPVCGVTVTCGLLTGREERTLAKVRREYPTQVMSYLTMIRVREIEGVPIKKLEWFRDLDAEDAQAIREAFEAYDCGYDTEVEMHCARCGHEWRQELPFDQSFFLARTTKK